MTQARIVHALATGRAEQALAIIFEYLALTQGEAGFPVPQGIGDLPPALRAVYESLEERYREPGALLVAMVDDRVCGCVAIVGSDVTERTDALVQRLYVRAPFRRQGLARQLMQAVHTHAAQRGFERVVLNVMPTRLGAIACYRALGYQPMPPVAAWPYPAVWLAFDLQSFTDGSDGAGVIS